MAMQWRWDQGRLDYFNFSSLRDIATVLVALDGALIDKNDLLRQPLMQTGLPFSPTHYTIWRNYARVFKWTLLATRIDKRLIVTDICHKLADDGENGWGVDDYFSFLIPRLYYPNPAIQAYDANSPLIFPLCAILRYLIAQFQQRGTAELTVDDTFDLIIGNSLDGTESFSTYLTLSSSGRRPRGDEKRQIRELMIFIAQSSFLKWDSSRLTLDVMVGDDETLSQLQTIATPIVPARLADADSEIVRLGTVDSGVVRPVASVARERQDDLIFTEGRRVRVTHLRVERSPRLRRMYFASLTQPFLCDMCHESMNNRYPWTENLLEIHHLLPLSSAIRVTSKGTSFDDLVPLCPNCHKSVHAYYRMWLRNSEEGDFRTVQQSKDVYSEAKREMVQP